MSKKDKATCRRKAKPRTKKSSEQRREEGIEEAGLVRKERVAAEMGVHPLTVLRWRQQGCPHRKIRQGPYLFDLAKVGAWAEKKGKTLRPGRQPEVRTAEERDWRRRREQAAAELKELDLAERRGELVALEDVERQRVERIQAVTSALEASVRPAAIECADKDVTEIEAILRRYHRELRRTFAGEA